MLILEIALGIVLGYLILFHTFALIDIAITIFFIGVIIAIIAGLVIGVIILHEYNYLRFIIVMLSISILFSIIEFLFKKLPIKFRNKCEIIYNKFCSLGTAIDNAMPNIGFFGIILSIIGFFIGVIILLKFTNLLN